MTFEEAAVLMRCVESGETMPSRLALTVGKDKGKITRLIDRLEAAELVKRLINLRDRRYSVIEATSKGKRLAERLAAMFDQIREDVFAGVSDTDIQRLSGTLPRLHGNAVRIASERLVPSGRRGPRIGEKKDHLQKVRTAPVEEPSPAKELSSATTDSQNDNGCERRDERLVRADSKNLASKPEEVTTLVTEIVLPR